MQETTTIIGSTTYLRKAGLSRKHLQKKRQPKKKSHSPLGNCGAQDLLTRYCAEAKSSSKCLCVVGFLTCFLSRDPRVYLSSPALSSLGLLRLSLRREQTEAATSPSASARSSSSLPPQRKHRAAGSSQRINNSATASPRTRNPHP